MLQAASLRSRLRWAVYALVAFSVAGLLWRNWDAIAAARWRVSPIALLLTAAAYPATFFAWTAAWRGLVSAFGPAVWRRELSVFANSTLLRRVPILSAVWRFGGRAVLYREAQFSRRSVTYLIALEIALHSYTGALVLAVLTLFTPRYAELLPGFAWAARLIAAAGCAGVLAALLLPAPRLSRVMGVPIIACRRIQRALLPWIGAYVVTWIVAGVMLWLFFNGVVAGAAYDAAGLTALFATASLIGYALILVPIPTQGIPEVSLAYLASLYYGSAVAGAIALLFSVALAVIEAGFSAAVLACLRAHPARQ